MKCKEDVILILDSILDDYYFLWECYSDFYHCNKNDKNSLDLFSEALKQAYENKYFNFFKGQNFDGDEVLISDFVITDKLIRELLYLKNNSVLEVRITISNLGVTYLNDCKKVG